MARSGVVEPARDPGRGFRERYDATLPELEAQVEDLDEG